MPAVGDIDDTAPLLVSYCCCLATLSDCWPFPEGQCTSLCDASLWLPRLVRTHFCCAVLLLSSGTLESTESENKVESARRKATKPGTR
eukprot:4331895-Amphidinium_carterae.1